MSFTIYSAAENIYAKTMNKLGSGMNTSSTQNMTDTEGKKKIFTYKWLSSS